MLELSTEDRGVDGEGMEGMKGYLLWRLVMTVVTRSVEDSVNSAERGQCYCDECLCVINRVSVEFS